MCIYIYTHSTPFHRADGISGPRDKARFITMQGPEPRMVQDMVLVDSFLMEGTRDPLQGYEAITPWDSFFFPIWG